MGPTALTTDAASSPADNDRISQTEEPNPLPGTTDALGCGEASACGSPSDVPTSNLHFHSSISNRPRPLGTDPTGTGSDRFASPGNGQQEMGIHQTTYEIPEHGIAA